MATQEGDACARTPQNDYGSLSPPGHVRPKGLDKDPDRLFGRRLQALTNQFGYKILTLGFLSQFILQGFTVGFTMVAQKWLFQSYGINASQMQIFLGVVLLPTSLQPIIGLASDLFPINGYNRGPYVVLTTVAGAFCFAAVGLLPQAMLPVNAVVLCLIVIQLQFSTVKLLWSAKYAEEIHKAPELGPQAGAVINFGTNVFMLLATLFAGVTVTKLGAQAVYAICVVPSLSLLVPGLLNYFQEEPADGAEMLKKRQQFMEQPEVCMLAGAMLVGSIVITFSAIAFPSPVLDVVVAACVGFTILVLLVLLLCPVIARPVVFFFILSCCSLTTDSATMFYLTDKKDQFAAGPQFNQFFYISTVPLVMTVGCLVGIFFYQRFFTTWRYRRLFVSAQALVFVSTACESLFLLTGSCTRLGVNTHIYFLGQSVFSAIFAVVSGCCKFVMLPNLCPRGMEATVFALIVGADSMAITVSQGLSGLLMDHLGINPTGAAVVPHGPGEGANFDNLWVAGVLCACLPLVPLLGLMWLLPDKRQDESLIGDLQATEGCLWRRLRGRP